VESEGKEEEIDAGLVVGGQVDDDRFAGAGLPYRDLFGSKLDVVLFGFVDDGVAELLVGAWSFKADSWGDLGGDVAHVGLQLEVGDFAGRELPGCGDGQYEKGQSEDDFGFAHLTAIHSDWD
jgi:hypothetical protein